MSIGASASSPASRLESAPRSDRVPLAARVVAAIVLPILAGAATILLAFPDDTESLWAWPIASHMSAFALGIPYAAGVYFFARVLLERRWHRVSVGILPIGAFVTVEGLATIFHWDRFTHDHPVFWAWVALYATTPFLLPFVWWRARSTESEAPEPDEVVFPTVARRGFALAGAGQVTIALFLLLFPAKAIELWPWPLTPLTARSTAGWFAFGLIGLMLARVVRWSSARISVESMLLGFLIALLSITRAWGEYDSGSAATWVFVAFSVIVTALMAVLYVAMERRRRLA